MWPQTYLNPIPDALRKGIDIVRRDWCVLAKRAGDRVLDFILSGQPVDEVRSAIAHGECRFGIIVLFLHHQSRSYFCIIRVLFLHHQCAYLVVMETATVCIGIYVESSSPSMSMFSRSFLACNGFLRNNFARVQVVDQIHSYLKEVADDMQNDRIRLEEYTITKGLTKAPEEYSDAKSQPHVQVRV